MLLLEEPDRAVERARPDLLPDPVVRRVAEDRREREEEEEHPDVQVSEGRERPGGEQEGVPGQERRHDEAGLAEDDHEQESVRPGAVIPHDVGEVPVEVQEDVDQLLQQVHFSPSSGAEDSRKGR